MGKAFRVFPEAEHQTEPMLGWRAWRLGRTDEGLRIVPTTPRSAWEPRVAIHATCSGAHTREYMVYNPELAAIASKPRARMHVRDPRDQGPGAPGAFGPVRGRRRPRRDVGSRDRAHEGLSRRVRLSLATSARVLWCLWYGRLPAVPDRVFERGGELRPACEAHRKRPAAVGTPLEVDQVQQELLDTYGIEPLPVESFHAVDERHPAGLITRVLRVFDRARA